MAVLVDEQQSAPIICESRWQKTRRRLPCNDFFGGDSLNGKWGGGARGVKGQRPLAFPNPKFQQGIHYKYLHKSSIFWREIRYLFGGASSQCALNFGRRRQPRIILGHFWGYFEGAIHKNPDVPCGKGGQFSSPFHSEIFSLATGPKTSNLFCGRHDKLITFQNDRYAVSIGSYDWRRVPFFHKNMRPGPDPI